MKLIKLFTVTFAIALFMVGCDSTQTNDVATSPTYLKDAPENVDIADNDYFAPENFDLRAVGDVLKESDSAQDFERRLNSDDGVNNLDLNGDGYVDYISVEEYEDRDTGYRGFSLLDNFGGTNGIQEIATIILDRTLNDGRGSRIYLSGNEQIYGNDNYYQADWKDTTLDIVNWAFGNRNDTYRSQYNYDNYPDYYNTYRVIETPVYRSRIEQRYIDPIFVQTNPAMTKIKIKSKYKDKYYDKIYARIANPNDFQKEFRKKNPNRPEFVPNNREKVKNVPPGLDKKSKDYDKPEKAEKRERSDNKIYDKPEKVKKNDVKTDKPDKPEKMDKGGGKNKDKGGDKGNGKNKGGKKGKG